MTCRSMWRGVVVVMTLRGMRRIVMTYRSRGMVAVMRGVLRGVVVVGRGMRGIVWRVVVRLSRRCCWI